MDMIVQMRATEIVEASFLCDKKGNDFFGNFFLRIHLYHEKQCQWVITRRIRLNSSNNAYSQLLVRIIFFVVKSELERFSSAQMTA